MAKYKLTLPIPCISESCIKTNINLFFFHTSLWCLKRFYEGLKSLHKTFKTFIKPFEAPQRSVKKKFKLMFSLCLGLGRKGLRKLATSCFLNEYGHELCSLNHVFLVKQFFNFSFCSSLSTFQKFKLCDS